MQPLGRGVYKSPSKEDGHFKKYGLKNWWEDVVSPNKTKEKRQWRSQVETELNSR